MNFFLENKTIPESDSITLKTPNPKTKNISKINKLKKITYLHIILSIISLFFLSIYPITTNYLTKIYYNDFEKNVLD